MLTTLYTILAFASAASQPASLPAFQDPPTLRLQLVGALSDVKSLRCGDADAPCWKRSTLALAQSLTAGIEALRINENTMAIANSIIAQQKQQLDAYVQVLHTVRPVLEQGAANPPVLPVYKEPIFIFTVAFLSGILVTVAAVALGNQLSKTLGK